MAGVISYVDECQIQLFCYKYCTIQLITLQHQAGWRKVGMIAPQDVYGYLGRIPQTHTHYTMISMIGLFSSFLKIGENLLVPILGRRGRRKEHNLWEIILTRETTAGAHYEKPSCKRRYRVVVVS